MTYQGRSLDDQPLAAYSTGVDPDLTEEPAPPESPHLSQQEVLALALGLEAATPVPEPEPKASRRRGGLPRPRLPRLPKPSLKRGAPEPAATSDSALSRPSALTENPNWPALSPSLPAASSAPTANPIPTAAQLAAAPMAVAAPMSAAAPVAAPPRSPILAAARPSPSAPAFTPASAGIAPAGIAPAGVSAAAALRPGTRRWAAPDLSWLGTALRDPRTAVRDPRILALGAGIVVMAGLVLVLGGGNGPGAGAGDANSSPTAGAPVIAAPGNATVTLSGSISGTYSLLGSTGSGRPADGHLESSWTDATGSSLGLVGQATAGTRTTGKDLVVTLTVLVGTTPITFTSSAGECTVGMATKPSFVSGSFVCGTLSSPDGKYIVKATGNYQT